MTDVPCSPEAEAAVLGALLGGAAPHDALATLRREDFYRSSHRDIYAAVHRVVERGLNVDEITVFDELRASRQLEQAGGPIALSELSAQGIPSTANLRHHVSRVADLARRRRTIAHAKRLEASASDTTIDLDKAVEETTAAILADDADDGGLITVDNIHDQVLETIAGGSHPGQPTGWEAVDRVYTVVPGYVTVVTGIPGHGKSTFLDAMSVNLAKEGWRFAVFSPESAPAHRHAVKLLQSRLGRHPSFDLFHGEIETQLRWIGEHFVWLDDLRDNTIAGVIARARLAARRHGTTGLIIDPWNKLAHDYGPRMREDLYIAESLSKIGRFARREQVHVWVVAHPKQMPKQENSLSRHKVPTAYDISGGAQWHNMADAIVCVWRDKAGERRDPAIVDVLVQKVREEGWWGRHGRAQLRYREAENRFVPADRLPHEDATEEDDDAPLDMRI